MAADQAHITAQNLTMAYGDFLIQKNLNFTINRGDVFIIMGGSGCGKSTLLKIMIGLKSPTTGDIFYDGEPFWSSGNSAREATKRKFGTHLDINDLKHLARLRQFAPGFAQFVIHIVSFCGRLAAALLGSQILTASVRIVLINALPLG